MEIYDNVYGKHEVSEPILMELLKSSDLARLKHVSQYGVPDKYCHKKNFSRYEHSVGVMLLLRILGADLEEQVAGLLHDVSHTSFSHISDWIFGEGLDGKEDYQDNIHDEYIARSRIPDILKKHGYSTDNIIHNPNHTLLENNLPDVCADRIDYTLRELVTDKSKVDINDIVSSLGVKNNKIVFLSTAAAKNFAQQYLYFQKTNWGSMQARMRFALLGDAFKRALYIGIVQKNDFWEKDENKLLDVLEASGDSDITFCLQELASERPKVKGIRYSNKKVRFVDPLVLQGGTLQRLSKLDRDFAIAMAKSVEESGKVITLPHY